MSTFMYAQIAQQKQNAAKQRQAARAAATPGMRIAQFDGRTLRLAAAAEAAPTDETVAPPQTVNRYVEALSALIPAEVLTLHALTLSVTTSIVNPNTDAAKEAAGAIAKQSANTASEVSAVADAVNNATTTLITAPDTLRAAFWGLVLLSLLLYLVPRGYGVWKASATPTSAWRWYRAMRPMDWIRATIPPLSFAAWTMLQRATAFDAAFPHVAQPDRTVGGLFLAVALLALATWVAFKPEPDPITAEDSDTDANDGGGNADDADDANDGAHEAPPANDPNQPPADDANPAPNAPPQPPVG
jgi:hypothetical protein